MNSVFVEYEELSRSRRVSSTSAFGLGLPSSTFLILSYPTQPYSLIANKVNSYNTKEKLLMRAGEK